MRGGRGRRGPRPTRIPEGSSGSRKGGRIIGRGRGRNVPNITSIWQLVGSYKDPHDQVWYGVKRSFVNVPVNTTAPMTYIQHVIDSDKHTRLPNNRLVIGDDLL